ncbi:YhgE/Pip domain-containing protein [Metabacillus fastidiosus]|uniref:YhgE/Pip domain-containing protein n=1 Tax=Metabacillus fastidiosus TaxID=1458 RepID=UPI000826479E|nr:YhgE/Pip domain-containing protein [Metabacillus fastidiosus]MED4461516.1 YhgE/Pip domain-containing protein [Metabacillus fastidiosus]
MKKILHIYQTDWRNIFKVPMALFLIIGLMFLPSLYAWVNIIGGWDPYGNTSRIPIAVTNEDAGALIELRDIKKEINIGTEIVDSLKKSNKLGWEFVSKEEAEHGVAHGDYYASILIPNNFSNKVTTILSDSPEKPEIIYSVNEKINAIAPKITASGATGIVAQVSKNIVKTTSEAIFTVFNKVGIELEKELPTIRKIEHRILELEKHLPELENVADKALQFEEKLPEIHKKAEKIVELEKRLPEVEAAGDKMIILEQNLPKLKAAGDNIIAIQERLPEIQKAANRIIEIDKNFYTIEETIKKALENAENAGEIISDAQQALPEIEKLTNEGASDTSAIYEFLKQNEKAFQKTAPVIKQNLLLLEQMAYAEGSNRTATDIINNIISLFTALNSYSQNGVMTNDIQALNKVKAVFSGQGDKTEAAEKLNQFLSHYDSETVLNINKALNQMQIEAENTSDILNKARETLPNIKTVLSDTGQAAEYSEEQLTKLRKDFPHLSEKVHSTVQKMEGQMDQLVNGVNKAADFMQHDFPKLEPKIHKAADFVRHDLQGVEEDIRKLSTFIQTKLPEVENAVHKIANLIREDLPEFEDSLANAADKIRQFKAKEDIGQLIELLKNDIQAESDFLSHPVLLKEKNLYPIPNYGSAMSPFYSTLSLWVGALILASLLRFDVEDTDRYKSVHIYFGRLLTFITIGIFQAVIVTVGDMYILGTYVADKLLFVLFAILISIVFMTIIYTFVSVFGNIGKALAIVLLVLQLSGSGATFPIQVAPSFFQLINPFLPFTYAISLLREAVGGVLLNIAIRDILYLLIFLFLAFVLGVLLKKPLSKFVQRTAETAKKSKIIH